MTNQEFDQKIFMDEKSYNNFHEYRSNDKILLIFESKEKIPFIEKVKISEYPGFIDENTTNYIDDGYSNYLFKPNLDLTVKSPSIYQSKTILLLYSKSELELKHLIVIDDTKNYLNKNTSLNLSQHKLTKGIKIGKNKENYIYQFSFDNDDRLILPEDKSVLFNFRFFFDKLFGEDELRDYEEIFITNIYINGYLHK